jgi:hypothetical protein
MSEDRKRAAIELIRTSYLEADALFRSLDPADLERPVFTGEGSRWRVRDLIAHYAYWQTIAARCAEKMANDRMPAADERMRAYLDIPEELDEMNDANFQAWRARSAAEGLAHLRAANRRLVAAMEALPPDRLISGDGPEDFHRYLWQPGLNHLRQHREHIDAALKEANPS